MYKQVIILRTDLGMGKGKLVAQGSHASIEAFLKTTKKNPELANAWHSEGMKKIVLKVNSEKDLLELFEEAKLNFSAALIIDAGHTQIPSGSKTAVGIGPALEQDLDQLISKYKLL